MPSLLRSNTSMVVESNPRDLFGANEQGAVYITGDVDGATELKRAWRRNLATYSEQLNNSAWTKNVCTVTANAGNDYLGNATADKIIPDAGSVTNPFVRQDYTAILNASYTFSFDAKASGYNIVQVFGSSLFATHAFDLSNGTVALGSSGSITSLGDGWYRCSVTSPATATSVNYRIYAFPTAGVSTFTADGTSGILVSRVQFEQSSTPTEYQPITDFSSDFLAAYPTHTLYQDSTGVTPAVYPGDPVGLQLDLRQGGLAQIGADLVTNGGFAADTDWTKGANWTIGSGVATKTGGAANNLTQTIGSTAASWYRISMAVTRSAGTLTVSLGTSGTTYAITATGSYTFFILAGSGTQTLTLAGDSSFAGTVDNVVVRNVPGNHRYATSTAFRPLLARTPEGSTARRNLLTRTEEFDNAAWTKSSVNVSANAASPVAPDGNSTADTLTASGANGTCLQSYTVPTTGNHTFSVYLRRRTGTGTVEIQAGDGVYSSVTLTADWARFSVTASLTAGARTPGIRIVTSTDAVDAWGGQLETGSSATAYQKVTVAADVTEAGKRDCWALLYNGSNNSLITASVDFSATDEMTVIAGVRKLSDAAIGMIVEATANANLNNGTFFLTGPLNAGVDNYASVSRGTSASGPTVTGYSAPISNILTISADISADTSTLRVNTTATTTTSDQGTGNYGNHVLYFGRRNNASLPFNGYEYGMIIRGATTTDARVIEFERYLGRKAGIVI